MYARLVAESRRSGLALAELLRPAIEERYGSNRSDDALRAHRELRRMDGTAA